MNNSSALEYSPFHLAIPSNDLQKSRQFYGEILGCQQGRTDPANGLSYKLYGNQLVAHFATSAYCPKTFIIEYSCA